MVALKVLGRLSLTLDFLQERVHLERLARLIGARQSMSHVCQIAIEKDGLKSKQKAIFF